MSSENKRVLIVDDDPAMLRILRAWLEKAGYQVQTFSDGREALTSIEDDPPDFLITDWEMPHMTGLELCHRVRELNLSQYIYTIFLTVKSTPTEMIEGLEIGADDFLSKPIHQGELLARVRAGARIIELERRLGTLARTDYLTGLMTQRVFYESLDREWARVARSGAPLSCVMMDIDFFKKVNDVHGHPAGDSVLRAVADLLRKNSRTTDMPCRYGGEEFCVLLPETNEANAVLWAERMRQQLLQTTVSAAGHDIGVTGSFGVAQRCDASQKAQVLVDQADQALLCAKQTGRNRVVCFDAIASSGGVDKDQCGRRSMFAGVLARHVMSPVVACLREDETIGQAAEYFLRLRINSACVVDSEGRLAGMLSEQDLIAAMVSLDCWHKPLREAMKPDVICYDEDTPVEAIHQFLCRVSIRRVVIVSEGRPTGTVSRGTLLRWFRNLVIAREPRGDAEAGTPSQDDPARSRHRLIETARAIAGQTADLSRRCQDDPEGLEPYVVGEATRIQDLVNDLLAYCGSASQSFSSAASAGKES
jgi:two-component system, cell cycle response regulator